MVQIQKEGIRQAIIKAAKSEFIENGFTEASIRDIAKRAGTSPGNIYKYFSHKDEILSVILTPLLSHLESMIDNQEAHESEITIDVFTSEEYKKEMVEMIVGITDTYRQELDLLINKSAGSKVNDYYNSIVNRFNDATISYLKTADKSNLINNKDISKTFQRMVGAYLFGLMGTIAESNLSQIEVRKLAYEYMIFSSAGWKAIFSHTVDS